MRDIEQISSMRQLGDWLRRHIQEQGLSIKDLVRPTLSQSTLYNWLKGEHLPKGADGRFYEFLALDQMGLPPQARHALDEVRIRLANAAVEPPSRGLPGDVGEFTGRRTELSKLDELAARRRRGTQVIAGTGGVGKTALVVHWARSAKARKAFPDGYLYLNLHGYSATEQLSTRSAVNTLLLALGEDPAALPWDLDALIARYQDRLNGRSILLVLDNVRDEPQVRRLLPASSGCFAVITSRDRLLGLVARDGVSSLSLDRLSMDEAVTLLRRLLSLPGDDAALADLASACARLPLALRVAATAFVSAPQALTLNEFVAQLAVDRLQTLEIAPTDSEASARAVFSWSVRHLRPEAARAFRLLGAHPGQEWDAMAAAALFDVPPEQAGDLIAELVTQSLVEAGTNDGTDDGRFGMHDLLREYACELATAETGEALDRLLDYYLHTAQLAKDTSRPWDAPDQPSMPGSPLHRNSFADPEAAERWLAVERQNLVAAAELACDTRRPDHAGWLSGVLWRLLYTGGHHDDALKVHGAARDAAREAANQNVEAAAEFRIGDVYWRIRQLDLAMEHFERSLRLHRETGNRLGIAHVLSGIVTIHLIMRRYGTARDCQQEGLRHARAMGDWQSEIVALANLAEAERGLGNLDAALAYYQRVRELEDEHDDRESAADTLAHLGSLLWQLDRVDEAKAALARAHELAKVLGIKAVEALALGRLGALAGDPQRIREGLELMRESGDLTYEAELLEHLNAGAASGGRTRPAGSPPPS